MSTRVVVVQGSGQLLTAAAAIRQHEVGGGRCAARTVVFAWGLGSDTASAVQEIALLQEMVAKLGWQRIAFFSDPELLNQFTWQRSDLGIPVGDAEELWVSRDWLAGNDFFLWNFRTGRCFCYGDGIGFYFGEKFARPGRRRNYFLMPGMKLRHRAIAFRNSFFGASVSQSYLSHPHFCADTPCAINHPVHASTYHEVIRCLAASWKLPEIAQGKAIGVFLSSNCSESRRTSREAELGAYLSRARDVWGSDARIVFLKPHPRESATKVETLRALLASEFGHCFVLPALPLELIFGSVLAQCDRSRLRVLSFGASSLSVKFLWGIESDFGFGKKTVEGIYFTPHRAVRLRFEACVLRALGAESRGNLATATPGIFPERAECLPM